MIFHWNTC